MTVTRDTRVEQPWTRGIGTVARALGTDTVRGLSGDEASHRLSSTGPNELVEGRRVTAWERLLAQFANTLTVVLVAAAVITGFVGDLKDTVVIGTIVVLDGLVGFFQERRAEQATAALERLAANSSQVVRDGRVRVIAAAELVPGDLIRIAAGDVVPADARLTEVRGLRVNESALTGESEPVAKSGAAMPASASESLVVERVNMVFKGTAVTYGRAEGIVVATGMATELGRVAALIQAHPAGPTPLQLRLAHLGQRLAMVALAVCVAVFMLGVATGEGVQRMFLTAVSLAVAAIPEGMPAVVTVALALGARRMADRRAVVRRLPAVETLGSVTVICTDKTGTLTQNRMVVERLWTPGGTYEVAGTGYEPSGSVTGPTGHDAVPRLGAVARVAEACNDAVLHPPAAEGEAWHITGDPTDGALLALAGKLQSTVIHARPIAPRRAEIGFDPDRRRMTTLHQTGQGWWVAVKGALDALGPLLDPAEGELLERSRQVAEAWAADGYRVLALAERHLPELPHPLDDAESELHLVGVVAIADPPRPEATDAIALCRRAGITPVMITGDHPRTAQVIARRVGLLTDGGVLTGRELDQLDDDSLAERISTIQVFARTSPEQKLRIVNAWKRLGAVVAMTGDGVNDAPALRRSDIGVAMGLTGTDVSKEAADMVLTDDNFATIVHAVEEGRRIYENIRRFVRYLLTTNSGEVLVMALAPVFGLPLPLVPVQILWINLITDGLPAVALGLEPAEADAMQRSPRPLAESILGGGLWQQALWVGLVMAATVIPIEALAHAAGWPWQTMVFTTLAFLQLGSALAARSERRNSLRLSLRSNLWLAWAIAVTVAAQLLVVYVPGLQGVFRTETLSAAQLGVVVAASTTAFIAIEVDKARRRGVADRELSEQRSADAPQG